MLFLPAKIRISLWTYKRNKKRLIEKLIKSNVV